MEQKSSNQNSSVVLQSRSQSEIISSRRKARRARIAAVHTGVRHIMNEISYSSSLIDKDQDYDLYSIGLKHVAAALEE